MIEIRIARVVACRTFEFRENRFEGHDGQGLTVGAFAQAGCKEAEGEFLLSATEFTQRQSGSGTGDVVPVLPFIIGDGIDGVVPLTGRQ